MIRGIFYLRTPMLRLLLLLSLLIFTACDGKITTNSAVDSMVGLSDASRNYHFTFIDGKLRDFNISSSDEDSSSIVHYIDDRHINIDETIYNKETQTKNSSTRHFLYDSKGRLISLSVIDSDTKKPIIYDYFYNHKGFLSKRSSSDHVNDIKYETNDKGQIIKEIYSDQSGFNLFIYNEGKLKSINFHDDRGKYYGSMTFKKPIKSETLMLLE